MIAKLKGQVDTLTADFVILDVNGVGYQVFCSRKTLQQLTVGQTDVTLAIETIVRETFIHLYGFTTLQEQAWFRLLTTVQGVGMKVALAVLSALSPAELSHVIATQDKAAISRADGVGPKLAARLLNELKNKAIEFIPESQSASKTFSGPLEIIPFPQQEALSALLNLGYRRSEALEALTDTLKECEDSSSLEQIIRLSLKKLAPHRGVL